MNQNISNANVVWVTPAFLDKLRSKFTVSDIVGRKVTLISQKDGYKGLCPFHKEKTPSFTINDSRGTYHCFGCAAHGDIIKFVMETEDLSFSQAVEKLSSEAGMNIEDFHKECAENIKKSAEQAEIAKKEYLSCFQKYIEYPSCDAASMLMVLSGEVPSSDNMLGEEIFAFYVDKIAEFFERAFRIDDAPIAKKGSRTDGHDSLIRPKEFLNWCIDAKAPLSDDVRQLVMEAIGSKPQIINDNIEITKNVVTANQASREDICIADKELYKDFIKRPLVGLKSAIYICSGFVENLPEEDDWEYHQYRDVFSSKTTEAARLEFIQRTILNSDFSKTFPFEEGTGIEYSSEGKKEYWGIVEPIKFIEWLLGRTNNLPEDLKQIYFEEKDKAFTTKYVTGYTSPYIELMKQAIIKNKISKSKQGKKESLTDWFMNQSSTDVPISKNMAKMMATIIRLPESQKGGLKKTNDNSNPF